MKFKKVIKHNQYYTSKNISDLVTRLIITSSPKTCLELSAGEGALLESSKKKWPNLHCTTFDIDPANVELLKRKFPTDSHYCADATSKQCQELLASNEYDIAVCNPPFSVVSLDDFSKETLSNIFDSIYQFNKNIRSEILFFAINMNFLKQNGIIAIIVPELIVKGYSHEKFRQKIVETFTLEYIIECDHKSFNKTEAKTYVLIIKKSHSNKKRKYKYIRFENSTNSIKEETLELISFVSKQKRLPPKKTASYEIIRGNLSGKECKNLNVTYLHTINMSGDFQEISVPEQQCKSIAAPVREAMPGDIIIARVGSRVLGKTNILSSGKPILSDCVFAIRFKNELHKKTFLSYWKENKNEWLKEFSTGTCAKHITITNLSKLIDSLI